MEDYLAQYESYLKNEKCSSANTCASYLRDMHQFSAYIDERGIPLHQVVQNDVEQYAHHLVAAGKAQPLSLDQLHPSSHFIRYGPFWLCARQSSKRLLYHQGGTEAAPDSHRKRSGAFS